MSRLPYDGIRIIERSETVTGRLIGLLFADQGAEVIIVRKADRIGNENDSFFDRNKSTVDADRVRGTSSADVIILDGSNETRREEDQVLVRVTAALPGDADYGHLAADCSEDLLSALVGFFTNMEVLKEVLGRPVIYTPLPLCSVYAGVNGAIAVGAALVDRERCGKGREITVSRLAGGLSAIGALSLTSTGIPEHLAPMGFGGLPKGVLTTVLLPILRNLCRFPSARLWLARRFAPLSTPYRTLDNRFALVLASPNRRNTRRLCQHMGIWDELIAAGMVDVSAYDPANHWAKGDNAADALSLKPSWNTKLAKLLEKAYSKKTAEQWEVELCGAGLPCVKILSWEEWKNDSKALEAGIFAKVGGLNETQIGRSAWVESAQPYPELRACAQLEAIPDREVPPPALADQNISKKPLEGFILVDFSNVIAGPNCVRMFAELGATVYRIEPLEPEHSPTIMITFSAESGVGKQTIILDIKTEAGRDIMNKLVAKADMVVANKLDAQFERLGLDRKSLDKIDESLIGLQLSAHAGEKAGPRHDFPGYDPVIQGMSGLMDRFGPEGCPSFHGIASCVDYLCGYLGAWAGVTALVARSRRKDNKGDWATSSLATAASLTQLLLQKSDVPDSAKGPYATGMNAGERVYRVLDGWIFAQGDHDLRDEIKSLSVETAISTLKSKGILAVPVQTCEELRERHRGSASKTVKFEKRQRDGWQTECFAPTWFVFDGEPVPSPPSPERIGAGAMKILTELGYAGDAIEALVAENVVGNTEWIPNA